MLAALARAGKRKRVDRVIKSLEAQEELDKLGSEVREKNFILKGRGSPISCVYEHMPETAT